MEYIKIKRFDAELSIASFENSGTEEIHLYSKPLRKGAFEMQMDDVIQGLTAFLDESGIDHSAVVFSRFFVSDYANQNISLSSKVIQSKSRINGSSVSMVQQPPMDDSKVVLWAYIINDKKDSAVYETDGSNSELCLTRGGYKHIWTSRFVAHDDSGNSLDQTADVFKRYTAGLDEKGLSLKQNCIRTWLFVKDVDYNYAGVVNARKALFDTLDMTEDTHYISSTGIEGRCWNHNVSVLMDAYAVGGIKTKQVKFLQALDNLNPTHEYGVTFERGTSVDYGDRRHIFISGTASIDNKGEVVHVNQIDKQIERTLENISALLADADSVMDDVAQMIVYIRDIADRQVVLDYFSQNLAHIPKTVVLAPVCRPGWLIEIECIAIKKMQTEEFPIF